MSVSKVARRRKVPVGPTALNFHNSISKHVHYISCKTSLSQAQVRLAIKSLRQVLAEQLLSTGSVHIEQTFFLKLAEKRVSKQQRSKSKPRSKTITVKVIDADMFFSVHYYCDSFLV